MDNDIEQRLTALEQKLNHVYRSVEQTRKIILWTSIIGVVLFILPLIGLAFVIPTYIKSLNIQQYLQ